MEMAAAAVEELDISKNGSEQIQQVCASLDSSLCKLLPVTSQEDIRTCYSGNTCVRSRNAHASILCVCCRGTSAMQELFLGDWTQTSQLYLSASTSTCKP